MNLLHNAVEYNHPDGTIELLGRRAEGAVVFEVRDTGIGIPADVRDKIFERFYRADPSRSRDEGGTGLGLAIVKHLVEAHGGRVSAESERGIGTTITCWFPDSSPPSAASSSAEPSG